jgi:tRNA U34 2-thiouridine synthase MnmA/TrmU
VEYLQQQHAGSFDRIASGHYAKVQRHPQQQQQHSQPPPPQQQQHEAQGGGSQPSPASDSEAEAQSLALLEQQASLAQASSSGNGSSSDNGSSSRSSSDSQPVSLARLLMVPDAVKDQTYFLADLSPAQLARCMFPLGNFTKPQVGCIRDTTRTTPHNTRVVVCPTAP